MNSNYLEGFYGGAARGGKSFCLLMAALQYVSQSDYAALLLRRTYTDLTLPKALMDLADNWLIGTDAVWHEKKKTWIFPSGASLTFGYLESERDKYRYKSSDFSMIGFDELTGFTESKYTYLFSRLTRHANSTLPLRIRSASNPGDLGHLWVKARFITPSKVELSKRNLFFQPAYLEDNPYIDQEAYIESLDRLDPISREQLRYGNWDVELVGNMFKRESFNIITSAPPNLQQVRYWDLAASEPKKNEDPDWTVGALLSASNGQYYIKSIVRFQKAPADTEKIIKQTAQIDDITTKIYMEQEPGASGVIAIDHYARDILQGYAFTGIKSSGSKVVRAQPFSAAVENGNVKICKECQWIEDMLYELVAFPTKGIHDDIVDALSGAFTQLNIKPKPPKQAPLMFPNLRSHTSRKY
ncbi:MAG: phage terminase large subunit [Proteobacteria bacterium]|nr:phage terminase large subunit [Pseudomonadota bacterium]